MAKRTDRIGERFINNEGYEIIIVEYNRNNDLWVEFQDEYKARVHTSYQACQKGNVKNPSYKGKPHKGKRNISHTREYSLWYSMMYRCYSEKSLEKHPTYRNVTVCERWHDLQNFLKDLPLIEGYELWLNNDNYCLDKDLKQQGIDNKVYSLDTCCFITNEENIREMALRTELGKTTKKTKVYGINIKNGEKTRLFNSIEEACNELGVHKSCVSRCIHGERKTHGGYKWFEIEEEF